MGTSLPDVGQCDTENTTRGLFFPCTKGAAPNARLQAPPMAGARYERRLLVVACKPLFGGVCLVACNKLDLVVDLLQSDVTANRGQMHRVMEIADL